MDRSLSEIDAQLTALGEAPDDVAGLVKRHGGGARELAVVDGQLRQLEAELEVLRAAGASRGAIVGHPARARDSGADAGVEDNNPVAHHEDAFVGVTESDDNDTAHAEPHSDARATGGHPSGSSASVEDQADVSSSASTWRDLGRNLGGGESLPWHQQPPVPHPSGAVAEQGAQALLTPPAKLPEPAVLDPVPVRRDRRETGMVQVARAEERPPQFAVAAAGSSPAVGPRTAPPPLLVQPRAPQAGSSAGWEGASRDSIADTVMDRVPGARGGMPGSSSASGSGGRAPVPGVAYRQVVLSDTVPGIGGPAGAGSTYLEPDEAFSSDIADGTEVEDMPGPEAPGSARVVEGESVQQRWADSAEPASFYPAPPPVPAHLQAEQYSTSAHEEDAVGQRPGAEGPPPLPASAAAGGPRREQPVPRIASLQPGAARGRTSLPPPPPASLRARPGSAAQQQRQAQRDAGQRWRQLQLEKKPGPGDG